MLARLIIQILDWFYPFFKRLMPKQTFYYAACGGGNTLFGLLIFFLCENFVFAKQPVDFGLFVMKSHKAAMVANFMVSFPTGFYLARYVVFSGSALKGRSQLFRYFVTNIFSLVLNYINLTVLVDWLAIYPTPAQIINTVIVVTFSYLSQKYFAFRRPAEPNQL